ncbi:hypothetical protein D8674_040966 [Pyrus ussuriensis x Pyrus communis]|uniref:Uncharacterized protein n=1 Tax=Pyrus ussuriensis x Pyrus communis TaxID=2448454 RepID=A0A5N5FH88_9ROSA|nr:hypothetical protein D8674_041037 [Pyrus ussuriensis x Pyrus communis]KAB2604003.1 hypothetical protein D8674_040966 [Pyrus ussuriensis x Pyrus communis]
MYEGIPGTSETIQMNGIENQNDVLAANTDFVTYAQAPSTPGPFEEPNLFAVQEPMACSDHLDFEDNNLSNLASMGGSENAGRMSSPRCGDDSTMVSPNENGYHLGDMEIKQTKPQEHELIESISPVLECLNGTVGALDSHIYWYGMSAELIYLHTGTFDTSTTRVSENEQNNVSAVPSKDVESSLEPNFTKEIEPVRSTEPVIMRGDSAAQPAGVPIEKENRKEEDHNLRFHHTDA